jgi:hypothetical protein
VSEPVSRAPGGRAALLGLLGLAVAAQLVVLYAPSPAAGVPLFVHVDKVVHVLVFLVPTAVALLAGIRPAVVVSLFGGHALVSELVQGALLPSRSGDPLDVLADLTGVALGVLVWRAVAAGGTSPSPQ